MRPCTTLLPLFLATIHAALSPSPYVDVSTDGAGRRLCTVRPGPVGDDDVPHIRSAFTTCGTNGHVVFPRGTVYNISTVLSLDLNNVLIDWHGTWVLNPDVEYWRANGLPIFFQNHQAGFVISGSSITLDGHGTGGIDGNGNVWYTAEAGLTVKGRPMPFMFNNTYDVTVRGFSIINPPLWSINIQNGTNMWFDHMYVNATAVDAPAGVNWVQNTDGFDTLSSSNILLSNFVYQGGDDCVAIKPQSFNIRLQNLTCSGGNGIAIGSLGQYLNDSSVGEIWADNVTVTKPQVGYTTNEFAAYIKTWIGGLAPQPSYESAGQPRGGGWGTVKNIEFSNFYLDGPQLATAITQNSGDNGSFAGTSFMQISNIAFTNFTGYTTPSASVNTSVVNDISCSKKNKCFNIAYNNFNVVDPIAVVGKKGKDGPKGLTTCNWVKAGGIDGVKCTAANSSCPLGACGQA